MIVTFYETSKHPYDNITYKYFGVFG